MFASAVAGYCREGRSPDLGLDLVTRAIRLADDRMKRDEWWSEHRGAFVRMAEILRTDAGR
jgi:hypothetical protein